MLQGLLLGQLLPWVLMLPVLLVAMALVVRHAMKPVRVLAHDIGHARRRTISTRSTPRACPPRWRRCWMR